MVCCVTDRLSFPGAANNREAALIQQIRAVARAGADWIQVREKDLEAKALFDLAGAAISAAAAPQPDHAEPRRAARVLINDRLDVALAAGAAGVHLGENSLPAGEVARAALHSAPANFLVGVSCHSLESARRAAEQGASYVFFGPVFATPSKSAFGPPQGLPRLAEVCRAVSIPVLAIGGITVENASSCLEAGAAGIAAIRLFQQPSAVTRLLSALGGHRQTA